MYKEIYTGKKDFIPTINFPLSWTFNGSEDNLSAIKLGRKRFWLNGGSFSSVEKLLASVKEYSKTGQIIIRGCNKSITQKLRENGFREILFAKEGIIELKKELPIGNKLKRRIRSLSNRGTVREVFYSEESKIIFEQFLQETICKVSQGC